MPFGFALAAVVRSKRYRPQIRLLVSFVCSLLLTSLVESLQAFVSFRDPSFADIWCNTLGGLIGTGLYIFFGDQLLRFAAVGLLKLRPLAKPAVLGAATFAYAAMQIGGLFIIHSPGDLSGWDLSVPLVVGRNLDGEDPWDGIVSDIVLTDRAATPDEIVKLNADRSDPKEVFGSALVAHYPIRGKAPYPDTSGQDLPPLEWNDPQHPADVPTGNEPPPINHDQWLRTPSRIGKAIYNISKTSQYTLAATVATFGQDQRGPARIIGIAAERAFDLQVGQEFADLTIRARTAVHSVPEFYLHDVFADNNPHRIAVTQKDAQIVIYVDGHEQARVEITPEAKMIWRLYPRGFRIWIDRYGFRSYAAIYRLLVLIPFAALLGAALSLSRLSIMNKRRIGIGATLAMVLSLEVVLGSQSASGFQPVNLLINLAIALGSLGLLSAGRKKWSR